MVILSWKIAYVLKVVRLLITLFPKHRESHDKWQNVSNKVCSTCPSYQFICFPGNGLLFIILWFCMSHLLHRLVGPYSALKSYYSPGPSQELTINCRYTFLVTRPTLFIAATQSHSISSKSMMMYWSREWYFREGPGTLALGFTFILTSWWSLLRSRHEPESALPDPNMYDSYTTDYIIASSVFDFWFFLWATL
jgi:hypothetical protein